MFLSYYLRGIILTVPLIVAIGAQNAYVLKQGLLRNHVFLIVNVCIFADILVFALGGLYISWIEDFFPRVSVFIYLFGALFLWGYGAVSFLAIRKEKGLEAYEAVPTNHGTGEAAKSPTTSTEQPPVTTLGAELTSHLPPSAKKSKLQALLTILAVTFLNPHFYIDTFFIIGTQLSFLKGTEKLFFFLGCCSGSIIWFYGLGYGSRSLGPLLARPRTWKILNFLIGVLMWVIGYLFTLEFLDQWGEVLA